MNAIVTEAARRSLGKIVTVNATGEYARARVAFGEGSEHPGMVELGMTDGTTRMACPDEYEVAVGFPGQMRAFPVFPDSADGSSRPVGRCSNEGCGLVDSNVISVVDTRGARFMCGAWYVKRRGREVKAPTAVVCTHCYALGCTPFAVAGV